MSTFELKVITPDGVMFDGEAESIFARTVMGDVLILPRHINYLTVIENGMVKIKADGAERRAACSDGFLSVADIYNKTIFYVSLIHCQSFRNSFIYSMTIHETS